MLKKLFLLCLTVTITLTACGGKGKNGTDVSEHALFEDVKLAKSMDLEWLFLPEKAVLTRDVEKSGVLEAAFTGCEYEEINAYALNLYSRLIERGYTVYDASTPFTPIKLSSFVRHNIDTNHAGNAYRYYYTKGYDVYMLELDYYGCGNGTYGNGQSVLKISDVTENAGKLIKE